MFERIFRRDARVKLRCAVVTPIGPGHAQTYGECKSSVNAAWRTSHGPFAALDLVPVDDSEGVLGRSRARNRGVQKVAATGVEWIFFLDADDVMLPDAFANVADCIEHYDAVWGLIASRAFEADEHHLRLPQILSIDRIESLLLFDPFLTLQMGHFVRTSAALSTPFNEDMNAGEDFDYYLRLWEKYRCVKVPRSFFVARQGRRSQGPRAATAESWGDTVRSRLMQERARFGLDASSPQILAIKNAAVRELQDFYRERGLVDATNHLELSRELPYRGIHKIELPGAEPFDMYSDNDDPVCLSLAWTGEYRDAYSRLWQALSRPARLIFDIGAGTGFYGLLAASTAGPEARIYCLESFAENYARLCRNIDANGFPNINARHVTQRYEHSATAHAGHELVKSSNLNGSDRSAEPSWFRANPLPSDSVEDFARVYEGVVTLARIDLAGRNSAAVAAMTPTIARLRPDVLLDLGPGAIPEEIEPLLNAKGYRRFALNEDTGCLAPLAQLAHTDKQCPTCWLTARNDAEALAVAEEAGLDLRRS